MTPQQQKFFKNIETEVFYLQNIFNGNTNGMAHLAALQDSINRLKQEL